MHYITVDKSKMLTLDWWDVNPTHNSMFQEVLGCHPHLSCPGEVLGFCVALFKACGCGQGLCPKQVVQRGPSI